MAMRYERRSYHTWYVWTPKGRLYCVSTLNRKRMMKQLKRSRKNLRKLGHWA